MTHVAIIYKLEDKCPGIAGTVKTQAFHLRSQVQLHCQHHSPSQVSSAHHQRHVGSCSPGRSRAVLFCHTSCCWRCGTERTGHCRTQEVALIRGCIMTTTTIFWFKRQSKTSLNVQRENHPSQHWKSPTLGTADACCMKYLATQEQDWGWENQCLPKIIDWMRCAKLGLQKHLLNKEISNAFKQHITGNGMVHELCPAGNHRHNIVEQAFQTLK